jgi:AraC-like DNA-binding protein
MRNPKSKNNNLTAWLSDPRGEKYFGRTFAVRAAVLAHLLTGTGTLADVAREHGVSRQAVHRHFRRALAIYGASTPG